MILARLRSFLILVGIVVMSGWVAAAQPPGGGAAAQPPGAETAQPPGGGFDFPEEEEEAPSWADDIRAQAVDIALVVGILGPGVRQLLQEERAPSST